MTNAVLGKKLTTARNEIGSYFQFPGNWTAEHRRVWNIARYIHFEQQMQTQSKLDQLYFAHFLQPMPLVDKKLTSEEAHSNHYVEGATYQWMMDAAKELKHRGVATVSLVDIFQNEKGTIYGDNVHCKYVNGENPGYQIMAKRMGLELAKLWKLKTKVSE